jgi:integrase
MTRSFVAGATAKSAVAATASSACAVESTVPAPTSIGPASRAARIASAAPRRRNVISRHASPPASSAAATSLAAAGSSSVAIARIRHARNCSTTVAARSFNSSASCGQRALVGDEHRRDIEAAGLEDAAQRRPIRVEAREGHALEYEELLGLASWLPERVQRVIPFCGTVRLRFTEAVTLTDDRVDLEAGTIFIPGRLNKSRRPKPIPLARVEVQLLREQLLVRPPGTRVVFATEKAGVYSHSGFQSIWLPALLAAGLAHAEKRGGRELVVADFRFHWLRHTAISLMARAGMKAELIAERVGHKDGGALIYRRYRHLFPSEVREAVSMLDPRPPKPCAFTAM